MRDGIEDIAPVEDGGRVADIETEAERVARRPRLVYPFETGPEVGTGEAVDVAPGVKWFRMPLGGSLAFINVWAIEDGEGWALVDTGLQTRETAQAWRTAFKGVLDGKPVTRVIVTHLHPDHIGLAGWITRKH